MSSWLYPIAEKKGKHFKLDDGTEVEVSAQNFIKLVRNKKLREDKWWYITHNFHKVQIGDEIYIYTGDRDLGIIGYATVIDKEGNDQKTWKLRVSHDLDKCRLLLERPISAIKVRSWIHFPRFAVYNLQDFEVELKSLLPWEPINKTAEIEKRVVDFAENEIATSEGQGINVSVEAKRAIENYSMERAKKYFGDLGYIVKDVSVNHSYDLRCVKDNEELLVEVKGTQTDGKKILLSRNEVKIASNNKGEISLYILHSIKVIETQVKSEAIGGLQCVINPWDIEMGTLTPLVYEYKIPKTELKQEIQTRKKI